MDSGKDYALSKMVEEGYEKAGKRKLRNRIAIIGIGVAILIILIIGAYFLLR